MIDLSKISNLTKNPSASDSGIDAVENEMGAKLPKAYRELLRVADGFLTGKGVAIYGTEDIIERNETWEVEEYAKGYVAVGDDSGGTVFLMSKNIDAKELFAVDSGYMDPEGATLVTSDFTKWVADGCRINEPGSKVQSYPDTCDVILVASPAGGSKDLLTIKNTLGLDMPIGELLKGSKNLPFLLMKGAPYGKTVTCLEQLGDLGKVLKLVPVETD